MSTYYKRTNNIQIKKYIPFSKSFNLYAIQFRKPK